MYTNSHVNVKLLAEFKSSVYFSKPSNCGKMFCSLCLVLLLHGVSVLLSVFCACSGSYYHNSSDASLYFIDLVDIAFEK